MKPFEYFAALRKCVVDFVRVVPADMPDMLCARCDVPLKVEGVARKSEPFTRCDLTATCPKCGRQFVGVWNGDGYVFTDAPRERGA